MSTPIQSDQFNQALFSLLDETFDSVHGIYLDKGTSLFETLATISAAEASIPVGGKCATLAAQVKHITFYLDVLEHNVRTQQFKGWIGMRFGGRQRPFPLQNGNPYKQSCVPATTVSNSLLMTRRSGPANLKSAEPSP